MVREKTGVKEKQAKGIKEFSEHGDIKHIKKKNRLSQRLEEF